MDVARVLVRTTEKPNITRSLTAIIDGEPQQLELREDMGSIWRRRPQTVVSESFPPSPFTTALLESDEDPTTRLSDDGSSVGFSDDTPRLTSGLLHRRRRQWATALNLWRSENANPTEDDVSSDQCGMSLSHPAALTPDGPNNDACNGPPLPYLHANGRFDPRDFCSRLSYDRNEEILPEDKDKADTEKLQCCRTNQKNPADNTSQSLHVVNRDSNFKLFLDKAVDITDHSLMEEKVDQNLGLVLKGPFPKGGVTEFGKVYTRRKEGAKEKYKAQTNLDPNFSAISEVTRTSKGDLGEDFIAHTVYDAHLQPNIATEDSHLCQPQLISSPSYNPYKNREENQEEDFLEIARDLGLTFNDNSGNIVKLKTDLKQTATTTAIRSEKGKDQLNP